MKAGPGLALGAPWSQARVRVQWGHQRGLGVPAHSVLLCVLQTGEASLFEVNIRYVGGLLSAFYLTGEEVSGLRVPGLSGLDRALASTPSHKVSRGQSAKGPPREDGLT